MSDRLMYRVYDKQEKLYINNIGIWRNCWMAYDLDLPENYYDTFEETPNIVSGFDDSICVEITDRFVIEQCTGLKDKNGVLIFEGDKIQTFDSKNIAIVKIIKYISNRGSFCMANDYELKDESFWNIWQSMNAGWIKEFNAEIIGTIHEVS